VLADHLREILEQARLVDLAGLERYGERQRDDVVLRGLLEPEQDVRLLIGLDRAVESRRSPP
jgi:hypothetical protein